MAHLLTESVTDHFALAVAGVFRESIIESIVVDVIR